MAQSQNDCSSCPKGITSGCKIEWNTPKKGVCQSDQEWYYFDLLQSAPGASIIVTPEKDTDVELYVTWGKSCPSTSQYDCISNSTGQGKAEECHHILTNFNSPNYFLVRRISGSGCYDILLSRYKSGPIQTTGLTTSFTTIPITETSSDEIGNNNLLIFILISIIIIIILLLVVKSKKVVKSKNKH